MKDYRTSMDNTATVAAFADSPPLRETLSVLLEHDCQLTFMNPDAADTPETLLADVALLATHSPGRLVHDIRRRAPALPIVAVQLPDASGATDALAPAPDICHVPLDPHAIRAAVLQRLTPDHDAALRASVSSVVETLRAELAYAFTALRTFSALHAASAGPDTYALLGAVLREQSHVVGESIRHMERFRARPRSVEMSTQFAAALWRQLELPDELAPQRGLLCACRIVTSAPPAGPLTLVPILGSFLRAHLRRRTETAVVSMQVTRRGIDVRYLRRRSAAPATRSWPLLLASLAVQPWGWTAGCVVDDDQETLRLAPAT